ACERVAQLGCINGLLPVYALDHKGKKIAFYMSFVGATGAGTCIEEVNCLVGTTKFVMFGSSGSLRPDIAAGKLVVPAEAYRDEGMSYHYAPPSEYIRIRNADRVADFLEGRGIPHVKGRVWTTDGVYRETAGKAAARRSEGCLAVEMECAGVQAVCDYRGWEYYDFLFAGDLLEEEGWDARILGNDEEIDHQMRYFLLALEFAATL
ncbi:MAG TPA: nucleoside phosphorylase, partial [Clostridia bacterium]|nr:nucleoside phosphorylase [Clostridia bacterium]